MPELATLDDRYRRALAILRARVRSVTDLAMQVPTYLRVSYDESAVTKAWSTVADAIHVVDLAHETVSAASWDPQAIEHSLRAVAEAMQILGRDESLSRLGQAKSFLAGRRA